MAFYKKRIEVRDNPIIVEWRTRYRDGLEQINIDMKKRWPEITAENFEEVERWKEEQVSKMTRQLDSELYPIPVRNKAGH